MNSNHHATNDWSASRSRLERDTLQQHSDDEYSASQPQYSQSQSSYAYYSQSQSQYTSSQSQLGSQQQQHSQSQQWNLSQPSQLQSQSQRFSAGENDDFLEGDDTQSNRTSDSSIQSVRNNDRSEPRNMPGHPQNNEILSPTEVIGRIETTIQSLVEALAAENLPELKTFSAPNDDDDEDSEASEEEDDDNDSNIHVMRLLPSKSKRFVFHNMVQCRMFSSILLVLSYCHSLLLAQRTTTTREVYYFYVTHFRSQKECDAAIVEAANLLQVPRASLGLYASPKGWYCGCIQIIRDGRVVMDGQALSSMQGTPITQEWLRPPQQRNFTVDCLVDPAGEADDDGSDADSQDDTPPRRAKCILVIEKEGVYNRFSEDRLYERYPCILVTGKGFPDLATRSLVHSLHHGLQLPVYGIADCNPYGALVLQTYQYGSERLGVDGGSRYAVPMQWLGLRPSQVEDIQENGNVPLPPGVFQSLSELDRKRLQQLLDEDHRFHDRGNNQDRYEELEAMDEHGYKMELEALNWLGKCRVGKVHMQCMNG